MRFRISFLWRKSFPIHRHTCCDIKNVSGQTLNIVFPFWYELWLWRPSADVVKLFKQLCNAWRKSSSTLGVLSSLHWATNTPNWYLNHRLPSVGIVKTDSVDDSINIELAVGDSKWLYMMVLMDGWSGLWSPAAQKPHTSRLQKKKLGTLPFFDARQGRI